MLLEQMRQSCCRKLTFANDRPTKIACGDTITAETIQRRLVEFIKSQCFISFAYCSFNVNIARALVLERKHASRRCINIYSAPSIHIENECVGE
jgi:hypothetical protein